MYGDYLIGYLQIVVETYLTLTYTPLHLRVIRLPQKISEHTRKVGRSRVFRICPIGED